MDTDCKNILEKCGNNVFYEYVKNNNSPMLLLEIDSKKIVYANNRAIEFYKYKIEELLSLKINDINILNKDEIEKKMEMAVKSLTNKYEFKHKIATGEIKDVQIFSNVIEVESEKYLLISVLDITAKKKKEKELFDKQLMIKDAQKIAKLGFWERDVSNDKYFWSDQIFEIYELDKSTTKPNYRNFIKLIHPDERSKFFKIINETILADYQIFEIETKLLLHQTKIKYVNLSFHRELDNDGKINRIFGTVQDITTKKEAELKLQNQNNELLELKEEITLKNELIELERKRYESLFKYSPVALWEEDFSELLELFKEVEDVEDFKSYLDENPEFLIKCSQAIKIKRINERTQEIFNVKNGDDLRKYFDLQINTQTAEVFKNQLVANRMGIFNFDEETEYFFENGENLNAILRIGTIKESNLSIVSVTDITVLKRMQSELEKANKTANESRELISEFLHNLSHEIRTPMNGIIGFTDILIDEKITQEKRNLYLNIIKNSGSQLLKIIDEILEVSRLETKHIKIKEEEVCVNTLLLELFSIFDIQAKENNTPLYLKTQITDNQSVIYSDRTKLIKIMSNLLENALKYTSKGMIEFGNYIKDKKIILYTKDTGIGIKSSNINEIFNRFARESNILSKDSKGLGLGLSIAKENAELLGGSLSVESVEGKGSTFFLTLPYNQYNSSSNSLDLENKTAIMENKNQKISILIAEDEEVNFLYIKILLLHKLNINCEIHHVVNGLEAVEKIKEMPKIDLILMDLKMPIMNGFKATKLIKEINKDIPIVAITAYSTIDDKDKAINAGCNDFISKPINNELFKKVISKYIKI